jgi:hypothetical protein
MLWRSVDQQPGRGTPLARPKASLIDFERIADHVGTLCALAAGVGLGVDLEFARLRSVGGNLNQAFDVTCAARPNSRSWSTW